MATKMHDLKAEIRQEKGSRPVSRLRRTGLVPAILYGKKHPATSLQVNYKELEKILSTDAGLNVIINLKITGGTKTEEQAAITCAMDKNVLNDQIKHVDFHALDLKEKLQTPVPVAYVGTAPGFKEGGILLTVLREIKVECLPLDIPSHFDLDISALELNKSLHVSDLKVDTEKIKILSPLEDVIVSCILPKEEVVEEVAVVEGLQPEVIGKEKETGEEEAVEEGKAEPAKDKDKTAKEATKPAAKDAPKAAAKEAPRVAAKDTPRVTAKPEGK